MSQRDRRWRDDALHERLYDDHHPGPGLVLGGRTRWRPLGDGSADHEAQGQSDD